MTTKKPKLPPPPVRSFKDIVNEAREHGRKAAAEAFEHGVENELTPEKIRDWTLTQIEHDRRMIFDKLMGVDRRWDGLEIKRGEGLFQELIEPMLKEQLQPLLTRELQPMVEATMREELPKLKDALRKRAIKDARWHIDNTVHRAMEEAAARMAQQLVEEMFAEARQ